MAKKPAAKPSKATGRKVTAKRSPKKKTATKKKKEKQTMPAAKKRPIMLRKPGGGSKTTAAKADKTPSKLKNKVSKPATPKKRATKGKKTTAKAAPTPAASDDSVGLSVDMAAIEELVATKVAEGVNPVVKKLDAILALIGEGPGGRSLSQTVVESTTLLHDSLHQKISNLYFGLVEDENQEFPTLDEEDGRDQAQNLLSSDDPQDILSFYMDTEEEEEEEEEEGEE